MPIRSIVAATIDSAAFRWHALKMVSHAFSLTYATVIVGGGVSKIRSPVSSSIRDLDLSVAQEKAS